MDNGLEFDNESENGDNFPNEWRPTDNNGMDMDMDIDIDNQNQNEDEICGCIICGYETKEKELKEKNSKFDNFFDMLENIKNPTFDLEYYGTCAKIVAYHNNDIYSSSEETFDVSGNGIEECELITIPMLTRHLYLRNKRISTSLYFETMKWNDYIENLSNKNNLIYENENGVVLPHKALLDSITKIHKMRNSNIKLMYDIRK